MNLREAFDPPVPAVVLGGVRPAGREDGQRRGAAQRPLRRPGRRGLDACRDDGRRGSRPTGRAERAGRGDDGGGSRRRPGRRGAGPRGRARRRRAAGGLGGGHPRGDASGLPPHPGLHGFLGEDDEWAALAADCGVRIFDVRKPPGDDELRVADGSVDDVDADVVLTVGSDRAVGKRTTTFELYRAARNAGLDAVVLVDDPDRERRAHFEQFAVRGVAAERRLVEDLCDATVAGVSTRGDAAAERYGLPAADVFADGGPERLLDAVLDAL